MKEETKKESFEEQMKRLEQILEKLNQESPLDEAIKLYEEASSLLNACQKDLSQAQTRIETLLTTRSEEGEITQIDAKPL